MQPLIIEIDPKLCNGCRICVKICPARAFTLINQTAVLTGECTFACDHCAAACPQAAIKTRFPAFAPCRLTTITDPTKITAPAKLEELFALMCARRSCRLYSNREVSREILSDLVNIAITAPSGTNSQKWTFSIIDKRSRVIAFGTEIAAYYKKLNRLANRKWLRRILKLCGKPELNNYYREYYDSISEGLDLWYEKNEDRLFHGAPALIFIGAGPGASCPQEDALLATQNILLAAESMNLGTCLIGFAVEALHRDAKIQKTLNIPASEKIYSVIALGYPTLTFKRPAQRRKITINWID
jgi:nitroreductase/NAD-dependent dihydropyrimidine dehydrogenase PreA subunit